MAKDVSDLQNKYEDNTSAAVSKWRSGVQNPNQSVADGLDQAVNIQNFDQQTQNQLNSAWESGADSDDAESNYENNTNGEKWARNFGDASNWSIDQS